MADPNSIDDLTKVGAAAGSGGLVVAITTLIGKFLTAGKLEEMRAQNAALAAQLSEMNAKMTILIAASERRDGEWDRLDAVKRFADLEARMAAVEKLLEQVVHQ